MQQSALTPSMQGQLQQSTMTPAIQGQLQQSANQWNVSPLQHIQQSPLTAQGNQNSASFIQPSGTLAAQPTANTIILAPSSQNQLYQQQLQYYPNYATGQPNSSVANPVNLNYQTGASVAPYLTQQQQTGSSLVSLSPTSKSFSSLPSANPAQLQPAITTNQLQTGLGTNQLQTGLGTNQLQTGLGTNQLQTRTWY
jgi:hypothetical protein